MSDSVDNSTFPMDDLKNPDNEFKNTDNDFVPNETDLNLESNLVDQSVKSKSQQKKEYKQNVKKAKVAYGKAKADSRKAEQESNYLNKVIKPDGSITLEVESCGFLLIRKSGKTHEVLLMIQGNRFDLPKGHRKEGEEQLEGAYRETEEETGISRTKFTKLNIKPFTEIYYPYYKRYESIVTKTLVIYFAELTDPDTKITLTEHNKYKWVPLTPGMSIQEKTIDPLIRYLEKNFAAL
jgi:8-oxo-dGTP pyrophosphatase MutT (NUDIX family)